MLKAKDTGIFEIFGRLFSQKFRENQQLLKLLTERSPLILTSANAKLCEFKTCHTSKINLIELFVLASVMDHQVLIEANLHGKEIV